MGVNIVLAKAHDSQRNHPEVQKELTDIQAFFSEEAFDFELNTVNFVILRGLYSHIDRMLTVVGVFVNKTEKPIHALKTTLTFKMKNHPEVTLSGVKLDLPESFLGEVNPNEGFVLHIKVLAEGLTAEQDVFQANELSGELRNLEIAYQK